MKALTIIEVFLTAVLLTVTLAALVAVFMGHTHQLLIFIMCGTLSVVTIIQKHKEKEEDNV